MLIRPELLIPIAIVFAVACGQDPDEPLDESEQATNGNETSTDETDDSNDDSAADDDATVSTGSTCPTTNPPTYGNFGEAFMTAHCTRCHASSVSGLARNGATPNYDFDTLEGILEHVEAIERLAAAGPKATNTYMPPSGEGPSAEQRERLGQWLACLANGAERAD